MFINITIAIVIAIAIALVCSTIILERCVQGQEGGAIGAVTNDDDNVQQKNFSDPNMTTLEHDNDTSPSSQ